MAAVGSANSRRILLAEPYFDHERLEVYRLARQFNREIAMLLPHVAPGHSDSKDNLRRSAKSITRNIAEGAGRWTIPDKVHFYHIARASATESAACLDELADFGLLPEEKIRTPKETAARIVAMLIAMIRSLEERNTPDMARPLPARHSR